jgi:hypothetical protein
MVFVAMIAGVTAAAPAAAEPGGDGTPPLRPEVTGTFEGTGTWAFSSECGIAREVVTGTYDATGRQFDDGTFSWDTCVIFAGDGVHFVSVTGTFVVTTDSGATLTGTVSGFIGSADPVTGMPVEMTLVVTESTGTPPPVSGTISLTGERDEPASFESVFDGTFSADLRPGR